MSVYKYSKYKIIVDPKSKKTQGLFVGDIVRRQYQDDSNVIYSLMLVLETGVDTIKDTTGQDQKSHYFIGALLDGSEPVNGQLLDFVRTTNLFDPNRGGALYMTASDSEAPYLDVIDGMATEHSLCYPYMAGGDVVVADPRKYATLSPSLVTTAYTPFKDGASRIFRITKNKTANTTKSEIGLKQGIARKVSNPQRVIVTYKARASKAMKKVPVTFGYTTGATFDGQDAIDLTSEWAYYANIITIDHPAEHTRSFSINLTNSLTSENDWCEVADMNIVLLSDIAGFDKNTKTRVGKISGVVDPVFGTINGYGAYFQNLYASKNVNIAGTLTAGDENGFASTFYVGKIHKNVLINSLDFNLLTTNHSLSSELSPVGVGKVCTLKKGTSDILAQVKAWLNQKIDERYCFSFWVKSPDTSIISVKIKGDSLFTESTPLAKEWYKISVPLTLVSPSKGDLVLSIDVTSEDILFTAPQLESGDTSSLYQPTDSKLSETDDYGAWFSKGGIGGTIQNPLLKLNEDGSISSSNDSFVIKRDGTGHFAGGAIKWTKDKVEFDSSVTMMWTGYTDKQINGVKSDISGVKKTADGTVAALGGASYPKLTKIDANGIYTGALTAIQVNAVDINASSIKTGTLSADRIAAGSIHGDKITANSIHGDKITANTLKGDRIIANTIQGDSIVANTMSGDRIKANTIQGDRIVTNTLEGNRIKAGTITASQLNVSSVQSSLITTGYIEGLSLNFVKGHIGGIEITSGGLETPTLAITGGGTIKHKQGAYFLNENGSGFIAKNSIFWDAAGNVGFSEQVRLRWTSYTDSKINEVEIGGANLLLDSADYTAPNWLRKGGVVETTEQYLGTKVFKLTAISQALSYRVTMEYAGMPCVYSFYIRATKDISTQSGNLKLLGAISTEDLSTVTATPVKDVTTKWTRISCSGRINPQDVQGIRLELDTNLSDGAEILVCGLKLERGNKPTGWSPSPADIDKYLTKIDKNGIYTGTLTASQVNAVNINASSIQSGSLSADRIAVNSLHGNKITSGTITATQLNVSNVQAGLITTGYIEGLSLNFTKGKIGNWVITSGSLTNNKISLTAAGSVWNTDNKWSLQSDGAGWLANRAISWDAGGKVTFSNAIQVLWTGYADKKMEDLQIGGRNLALNTSNDPFDPTSWKSRAGYAKIEQGEVNPLTGHKSALSTTLQESNKGGIDFEIPTQKPYRVGNHQVTISFYAKASKATAMPWRWGYGTFGDTANISTSWAKYVLRLDSTSVHGSSLHPYISGTGVKLWISDLMIEYGTKPSNWSPAPEDSDQKISKVDKKYQLEIKATNDKISSEIKGVTVNSPNLLENSDFRFGLAGYWSNYQSASVIVDDSRFGRVVKTTGNKQGDWGGIHTRSHVSKLELNTPYTVTVYLKADSNTDVMIVQESGSGTNVQVTKEWQMFTLQTGFANGTYQALYFRNRTNVPLYVAQPMYVLGNTPHNWAPSLEDISKSTGLLVDGGVRYIRDWSDGSTLNTVNHWCQIQAIDFKGNNVALKKNVVSNKTLENPELMTNGDTTYDSYSRGSSGLQWVMVDLQKIVDVNFVKVWHYWADGRTYHNTKTEVSADGVVWRKLFDSYLSGEYKETSAGKTHHVKDSIRVEKELSSKIEQTDSRITSEVSSITTKVGKAQTDIDNLTVGGRNYANNTQSDWGKEVSVVNGVNQVHFNHAVLCSDWKVGDNITVRFMYRYKNVAKTNGAFIRIQGSGDVTQWGAGSFSGHDIHNRIIGTQGEIEVLYSFKVSADMVKNSVFSTNIRHDYFSGLFSVSQFKVEKGTKPTDWSPSPEDVTKQIAETKATLNTKIDQTASKILLEAKNNAVNEVKAGIKITAESVTVFGQTMKVDSNLIAKSIEAGNLTVKGGNFQIQQSGTLSIAKGKIVLNADGSGKLANGKFSWTTAGDVTMTDATLSIKNSAGKEVIRLDHKTAKATIANGVIGGWTISDSGISCAKTLLTTTGIIRQTDGKWSLNADGSGSLASSNISWNAAGEVTFKGKIEGVTGTFLSLRSQNNLGGIGFGSEGVLWFEGDMQHQGYDYEKKRGFRFLSSDIWCRGTFGAYQRNVAVVYDTTISYYTDGVNKSPSRVNLELSNKGGTSHYEISLYHEGFPVDLLIFINNVQGRGYAIEPITGAQVHVVNGNNLVSFQLFTNNRQTKFTGGHYASLVNISEFMKPKPDSWCAGHGWMIGGMYDNNW